MLIITSQSPFFFLEVRWSHSRLCSVTYDIYSTLLYVIELPNLIAKWIDVIIAQSDCRLRLQFSGYFNLINVDSLFL